jgi:hypothetical protein
MNKTTQNIFKSVLTVEVVSLKHVSSAVRSLLARELAERGLSVNETTRLLGLTQTEDGAGRGEEI